MKHLQKFPVEHVLPLIGWPRKVKIKIPLGDIKTSVSSQRMLTYKYDGITCRYCGIKGRFFALEKNGKKFNLNLYGYDEHNHEVMLTSDHIIPKSKGGSFYYWNRRCLCSKCNSKRGNEFLWEQMNFFRTNYHSFQF